MRSVFAIGVAALALVVAGDARADAIHLGAFIADVLARNPSLRAGALRRDAFSQEAAAADLWPDPSLEVTADNIPPRMDGDMPMLRYQVSQMIPWPGKLGLMRAAVEQQGEASAAELAVRRLDLVVTAKRGYLMLALNARTLEVNAASRGLVATIARAALGRYGAGVGGHHEVARAEVERTALEVERLDLESERTAMLAMLNALRNLPPDSPVSDAGDIETPPVTVSPPALYEQALSERPELKAMLAMRREAGAMADLARRERLPDLMTGAWYNQVLGGPDSGGVALGVTLPIFGVRRQDRRAAAFDARAAGAAQDIAGMQAMIRAEVADALRKLASAARKLELLRDAALPRVRESFGTTLAAYTT